MNRRRGRSPLPFRFFNRSFVSTPAAMNSAPSLPISDSSFSPLSSDEGDITQIHNCSRIASNLTAVFPTRTQLGNPRTSQPTTQGPPLFCFCLRVCDPQHTECDSPPVRMHAARQSQTCTLSSAIT